MTLPWRTIPMCRWRTSTSTTASPTDCATAKTITTGTYNTRLNYQITYKTNYNDYRVLATNLLSTNNYAFDLSAISLMQDEVVTDVRLEFGKVPAGFASVVKPTVTIQTSANLANGYQVVNRVRCRRPVHEPVGNRTGCVDHSDR